MVPLNGPDVRMPASAWWTAFSHDGRWLYACGNHTDIWAWDARTFQPGPRISTGLKAVHGATLHPTRDLVAGGSYDGVVRVWDVETGREVLAAARHRGSVSQVRFTADGSHLVSAGVDGTVRRTDAATGRGVGRLKRLGSHVHGLGVVGRDGPVAAVHGNGVRVWGPDGDDRFRLDGLYYHGGAGQSDVALSGGGDVVWVTFRSDPDLRAWRLADPSRPCLERNLGGAAHDLAFSPDERLVAVALYREIAIIHPASGEVVSRWSAPNGSDRHRDAVSGLSFSPDGRLLASCDVTGGVWVWPLARMASPANGTALGRETL